MDASAWSRLAYVALDAAPDAPLMRVMGDDVGTTPRYDAWWAL